MKLNQSQIQNIENYLDYKKLEQVDLRYEVLDHMIVAIEQLLKNGISYEDAFNQQKAKWNPELESYSSFWLGLAFSGPKMMIKKCVRIIKKIHLKTIPATLAITSFFFFLFDFMPKKLPSGKIDFSVGFIFSCLMLLSIFWHFNIKTSNIKTTYQYFFRIQALNAGIVFLSYLSIVLNEKYYFTSNMSFGELLFPIYILVTYYYLFKVYKNHFSIVRQRVV